MRRAVAVRQRGHVLVARKVLSRVPRRVVEDTLVDPVNRLVGEQVALVLQNVALLDKGRVAEVGAVGKGEALRLGEAVHGEVAVVVPGGRGVALEDLEDLQGDGAAGGRGHAVHVEAAVAHRLDGAVGDGVGREVLDGEGAVAGLDKAGEVFGWGKGLVELVCVGGYMPYRFRRDKRRRNLHWRFSRVCCNG